MWRLMLGFFMIVLCTTFACTEKEQDHWSQIKELWNRHGEGTDGMEEIFRVLASLTQDQTLTLLRQFGKEVEANTPIEAWPEKQPGVLGLMSYYPVVPNLKVEEFDSFSERTKRAFVGRTAPGPLSDEEFTRQVERLRKDIKEGIVLGQLSPEAFEKLIRAIADRNEGTFVRYALAGWLEWGQHMSIQLSERQKEQAVDTLLRVAGDAESPAMVRSECCESTRGILETEFREIIYSDSAVQKALPSDMSKRPNVNHLVESGEIKLAPKTIQRLSPWIQRKEDFRKVLVSLHNDNRVPEFLRQKAKGCTK